MGGIFGIGGRPVYQPQPVYFTPPVSEQQPSGTIKTQAPDPTPATTPSSTLTDQPFDANMDFNSRIRAFDAAQKTDQGANATSVLTGDDTATQIRRRKVTGEG